MSDEHQKRMMITRSKVSPRMRLLVERGVPIKMIGADCFAIGEGAPFVYYPATGYWRARDSRAIGYTPETLLAVYTAWRDLPVVQEVEIIIPEPASLPAPPPSLPPPSAEANETSAGGRDSAGPDARVVPTSPVADLSPQVRSVSAESSAEAIFETGTAAKLKNLWP